MKKRIDNLTPGTFVVLTFAEYGNTKRYELARFVGIVYEEGFEGKSDKRMARFESFDGHDGKPYEWEAYRYNGSWAYGTSAQRLSLDSEAEAVTLPNLAYRHLIKTGHALEAFYVPNMEFGLSGFLMKIHKTCCTPEGINGEVFDAEAQDELVETLSSLTK